MLYKYNELLKVMEKIVEKNVKAYKTDFYEHDTEVLKNMEVGTPYAWIVREHGTHLTPDPEYCESITKCWKPLEIVIITRCGNGETYSTRHININPGDFPAWIEEQNNKYILKIMQELQSGTVFDASEYTPATVSYSFGYIYCDGCGTFARKFTPEDLKEIIEYIHMTPYSFLTYTAKRKNYEIA